MVSVIENIKIYQLPTWLSPKPFGAFKHFGIARTYANDFNFDEDLMLARLGYGNSLQSVVTFIISFKINASM